MEIIEQNEVEFMLKGLESSLRLIWAMAAALKRVEQQTSAACRLLREVDFRLAYREEDGDED